MHTLSVSNLRTGMRFTAPVCDINGRRLFKCGDIVTADTLRILAMWGIAEVCVEHECIAATPPASDDPIWLEVTERFVGYDLEAAYIRELSTEFANRIAARQSSRNGAHALGARSLGAHRVTPQDQCAAMPAPPASQQAHAPSPTPEKRPAKLPARPAPLSSDAILERSTRLATLPETFHRLMSVLLDDSSTAADAAEIVTHDPELSARVLRFANSPYLGLSRSVDTISRAVSLIGVTQMVSIASSVLIRRTFRGVPTRLLDMRRFWQHAISCGVAARQLALQCGIPETGRYFLSGLLHDMGRLAIFLHMPEHAHYLLHTAHQSNQRLVDLEVEIVGERHDIIGAALLEKWNCPARMVDDLRSMHGPAIESQSRAIVAVADAIANVFGHGDSGERLAPLLLPGTWAATRIAPASITYAASLLSGQVRDILHCMEDA